ncbi:hypothetical protein OIU77_012783 [Salix suchowensis]|uniref:Uncharacterized protein n=1 Tax=Salix suchowensis TaxID=1278906 RepID=A0ABQ9A5U3_9ROSI|nr:hypothetical protein OIU77_012783 [Salix suchowensis]
MALIKPNYSQPNISNYQSSSIQNGHDNFHQSGSFFRSSSLSWQTDKRTHSTKQSRNNEFVNASVHTINGQKQS